MSRLVACAAISMALCLAPRVSAQEACLEGRVRSPQSQGRCCWPGQSWARDLGRCEGPPTCPAGLVEDGDNCRAPTGVPVAPTAPPPPPPPAPHPSAPPPATPAPLIRPIDPTPSAVPPSVPPPSVPPPSAVPPSVPPPSRPSAPRIAPIVPGHPIPSASAAPVGPPPPSTPAPSAVSTSAVSPIAAPPSSSVAVVDLAALPSAPAQWPDAPPGGPAGMRNPRYEDGPDDGLVAAGATLFALGWGGGIVSGSVAIALYPQSSSTTTQPGFGYTTTSDHTCSDQVGAWLFVPVIGPILSLGTAFDCTVPSYLVDHTTGTITTTYAAYRERGAAIGTFVGVEVFELLGLALLIPGLTGHSPHLHVDGHGALELDGGATLAIVPSAPGADVGGLTLRLEM